MPLVHRLLALTALLGPACTPSRVATPRQSAAPSVATDVRELTADQQVAQVLSRLTFGARPGDADRVRTMGVDRWIAAQLQPERLADQPAAALRKSFPLLERRGSELLADYPPPGAVQAMRRRESGRGQPVTRADSAALRAAAQQAAREARRIPAQLVAARVARAVVSERQLQEVMVDFWHNHFSVFIGKAAPMRYYLVDYDRDVIRPHALGNFRELLGAVAASPAMLRYLDNAESVADSGQPTVATRRATAARGRAGRAGNARQRMRRPAAGTPRPPATPDAAPAQPQRRRRGLNENYARELLELHTLGVDGGYSQTDVVNVARAFTGWTTVPPYGGPRVAQLARRMPDSDVEHGFLFRGDVHDAGAKTVLGVNLPAGRGIEDGRQVLDIVARHPSTARYIATKLARRFVSDTPPPALVERAAATFTRTGGDIRETVRTIVTAPEFFSRAAYRAKVKSPFEVVVSALRAVNAAADTTPRTAQLVAALGQPLFGHQAPNGYPETGDAWINTGAILNRINFGLALAGGRVPGVSWERWAPAARLRTASRAEQVDGVVAAVLGGDVSADTRAVLLSGEHPLLASPAFTSAADSAMRGDSAAVSDVATMDSDAPDEMPMQVADAGRARGGRGGRRGGAFGNPPPLTGLAQVLGLALGSPEFQRK